MSDEIKTTDTMEIVVDDGMRDVRIRNLKGEQIGLFKFRPTDMGIIDRYNKLVKDLTLSPSRWQMSASRPMVRRKANWTPAS